MNTMVVASIWTPLKGVHHLLSVINKRLRDWKNAHDISWNWLNHEIYEIFSTSARQSFTLPRIYFLPNLVLDEIEDWFFVPSNHGWQPQILSDAKSNVDIQDTSNAIFQLVMFWLKKTSNFWKLITPSILRYKTFFIISL